MILQNKKRVTEQSFTKSKHGTNRLLAWIAAALLIIMSVLVIYQVLTRYILDSPSDFTEEIVRYLLIWTGFIDAVYDLSTCQHMALLIVHNKLAPEQRKYLICFIDALVFAFALAVLMVGGVKLAFSTRKEFPSFLGILQSLAYSMAPVSGVFVMATQIINIWEDLTGITTKEEI